MVAPNKDDLKFKVSNEAYTGPGYIFNSDFLDGLKCPENSVISTINYLEKNNLGEKKIRKWCKPGGIIMDLKNTISKDEVDFTL